MTTARTRTNLALELLRVSKEREDELLRSLPRQQSLREPAWIEEFATTAVVEGAHVDVDMISSCEQTAADARAHRRETPQETENW